MAASHSKEYKNVLRRLEIRESTSRTGSCLDGAAAESFFAAIKAEIGAETWPSHAAARRDIENWIKNYNERRPRSSIGYQPRSSRASPGSTGCQRQPEPRVWGFT